MRFSKFTFKFVLTVSIFTLQGFLNDAHAGNCGQTLLQGVTDARVISAVQGVRPSIAQYRNVFEAHSRAQTELNRARVAYNNAWSQNLPHNRPSRESEQRETEKRQDYDEALASSYAAYESITNWIEVFSRQAANYQEDLPEALRTPFSEYVTEIILGECF